MKKYWWICSISLLLAIVGIKAGSRNTYPLPEDRGTAGIFASLQKLPVYVRVLETTAHPDDENSGTLTWLSRRYHAQTALFCLTRGEGGQNILGPEKYDALGLLRTGELREACKYYGVDLYFGKVLDFGFSKTAEETLAKWGHQETLGDMVQFIRQWRPAILISRFQGSSADGHGHHQAAGILTREAFTAAADPGKFPEQLSRGLQPWLVQRFYVSGMAAPAESGSGTVRVPVGDYDPILGLSPREIAAEGYSMHRSQGDGTSASLPGNAFEFFRTAASSLRIAEEDDFFNSIDTSLASIFELAGIEKNAITFLRDDLDATAKSALDAINSFQVSHPEKSAAAVAKGITILTRSIEKVESSSISAAAKAPLMQALNSKLLDFQNAAHAVLGISLVARSEDLTGVPGEKEQVTVYFYNRGPVPVQLRKLTLATISGTVAPANSNPRPDAQAGGSSTTYRFSVEIAKDAKATEQFWHLENGRDARYKTSPAANEFAPFGEPEIRAEAVYDFQDSKIPISTAVQGQAGNPIRGSDFTEFQIVPALSLVLDPDFRIAPVLPKPKEYELRVSIINNQKSGSKGTLKLLANSGLRVRPDEAQFSISRKGETYSTSFFVQVPAAAKPGDYTVQAIATMNGQEFRTGYQVISYPENWTRNFYRQARSKIEVFDIKTPSNLAVGYIPGAGDEVPQAMEQLGIKIQTVSASELAFGDLSRFSAIVTGIRAYNVNEELKTNNQRILDYVNRGGTLIVQYVRPEQTRNATPSFPFGPYPMTVSDSERITVEDSPITILDPSNPIFNRPNKITEADFQGWVQERGLYFMSKWDSRYKPLLSGHDPGEEAKNGGMLIAHYGKGTYIYTGYAWFRQLPTGVPGAFRIFANMLSLGRKLQ
jgi:LmbE family N-acetylglucosaminyl deacetylase